MSPAQAFSALEKLAQERGVRVMLVEFQLPWGGHGGLCRIRGEHRIVVDASASKVEQAFVLARGLRALGLRPADATLPLRSWLERGRGPIRPRPLLKPLARAHPRSDVAPKPYLGP